jgi:nucleosome binding factor SPN SPT16 subunit
MGNRQKKKAKTYTTTFEVVNHKGRQVGMVCRNSKGKWAATWNTILANEDPGYRFDTKIDVVDEVKRRAGPLID